MTFNINITNKELFNANLGTPIKDAGRNAVRGLLTGFAVVEKNTDKADENGEIIIEEIAILKVDEELYSGRSSVMVNRLYDLNGFFTDEEIKQGIPVKFKEIKCKSGAGVSLEIE